ncbi:hypothetical protein COB57_02335 [Candidatus Peregrinibacteria bacterium]|nr:MAG: hypothetical protein COB57_02335 [Candidatus Peregrinibacteria bacterium]
MKILEKIIGSSSSDVRIVEIENQKYVMKSCDPDEVFSEKSFMEVLSQNDIRVLKYLNDSQLPQDVLFLEYIENSPTLGGLFNEKNCLKWGSVTKKMHSIKYSTCFKYNEEGGMVKLLWTEYLAKKIKKAFVKSSENNQYGFSAAELIDIKKYLEPLLSLSLSSFSLIHGDYHAENILLKNGEIIPFDKNPEVFSGDYVLDLAIALLGMPNETLIETKDSARCADKKCLKAFISGYENNILQEKNLKKYIMLIAFGRLYTPYSQYYKEIIQNLLGLDDTLYQTHNACNNL